MMDAKRIFALCALLLIFCLAMGTFVELADAQQTGKKTQGLDKKLATKRGISDSLASGKDDEDTGDGPSRLQIGVGLGSFVVAYIVVKWL